MLPILRKNMQWTNTRTYKLIIYLRNVRGILINNSESTDTSIRIPYFLSNRK